MRAPRFFLKMAGGGLHLLYPMFLCDSFWGVETRGRAMGSYMSHCSLLLASQVGMPSMALRRTVSGTFAVEVTL